ncbi:MAG: electron transfer flavoprotein, partial [Halobacteria archaeon]|nr:electron transfer flavoprotein [Halobacteria archaeon]
KDKLGAELPTRRPCDSAVAPGLIAVGDAAGHVNPTNGAGIEGAAKAGHWAGREVVKAVSDGDVSEEAVWKYNKEVMSDFGKKYAAMDIYNIFGTAHDMDELMDLISAIPGQKLADATTEGEASMSLWLKLKTLISTFGYWGTLWDIYKVSKKANEVKEHYANYPASPEGFEDWKQERDSLMDEVYKITGAEPKY